MAELGACRADVGRARVTTDWKRLLITAKATWPESPPNAASSGQAK